MAKKRDSSCNDKAHRDLPKIRPGGKVLRGEAAREFSQALLMAATEDDPEGRRLVLDALARRPPSHT